MSGQCPLLQIARALSNAKEACVLATLVNLEGSGYRRPGARMLIQASRAATGGITAGCLEEEIRQCAFTWTRAGARLKTFELGTPEDDTMGWGSGCKGRLQVLLQRVDPADGILAQIASSLNQRQRCVCAT